jgi:hypothetical protein
MDPWGAPVWDTNNDKSDGEDAMLVEPGRKTPSGAAATGHG